MPLPPEIKKLAQKALTIQGSQVPLHRALDILATEHGDVSRVMASYHDVREGELRRALHFCAELLREIEHEAGLAPAWEAALQGRERSPSQSGAGEHFGGSSGASLQEPAAAAGMNASSATIPDDLRPFVDQSARGQVRVAKAYTDGASKGNPGQAGIGVVIYNMDGKKIAQQARAIGVATNNIAEYSALIEAMTMAQDLGIKVLNVISDSELMVRQVSGVYKIKNVDILKKAQEVMALRRGFEKFTINYVGREHNKVADALSTSLLKKSGPGGKRGKSASSGKSSGSTGAPAEMDEGATD